MNILFVCTGNTCRSPMCEGFFRKLIRDAKRTDLQCESAGLAAFPASPASSNAVEVMKQAGIDLSRHRASGLTAERIEKADRIIVMTASHKAAILKRCPEARPKVFLLGEFASGPSGDIADPFGGNTEVYQECFREMKSALENLFLDLSDHKKQ